MTARSKHSTAWMRNVTFMDCFSSKGNITLINSFSGRKISWLDLLTEILQQYQNCVAMGPGAQTAVHGNRVRFTSSCNPTVQLGRSEIQICRELGETCVDNLTVTDLVHLEKQLEDALIQIRATKTHLLLDSISTLHEKEKMLAEEKRHLEEKIAGSKADGRTNKMIMDLNVIADSQMTE
ncbi:UNVERIFIED_CONTAM: hypothetical protein Scaly_1460800 [Sesamum calycinum]|uniref:K-box domain-containing protein n=1 Tax=Sesamum calycinum TaxID=2727403 RepID=A0AAW2PQA8_9LAMI